MDRIILGFLMIQGSTIYELRQFIKNTLSTVSSYSMGSIQAGVNKLLKNNLIIFKESVEDGRNKKTYFITEKGINYFKENLSSSMLYKEKNMELSKFFFRGLADKTEHEAFINKYIEELEQELHHLETIKLLYEDRSQKNKTEFAENDRAAAMPENELNEIAYFQYATLNLGMEKIKFEIEWFNNFKEQMKQDEISH